jgi:hypothetical protein
MMYATGSVCVDAEVKSYPLAGVLPGTPQRLPDSQAGTGGPS